MEEKKSSSNEEASATQPTQPPQHQSTEHVLQAEEEKPAETDTTLPVTVGRIAPRDITVREYKKGVRIMKQAWEEEQKSRKLTTSLWFQFTIKLRRILTKLCGSLSW